MLRWGEAGPNPTRVPTEGMKRTVHKPRNKTWSSRLETSLDPEIFPGPQRRGPAALKLYTIEKHSIDCGHRRKAGQAG
jgi:hypothetical protein